MAENKRILPKPNSYPIAHILKLNHSAKISHTHSEREQETAQDMAGIRKFGWCWMVEVV